MKELTERLKTYKSDTGLPVIASYCQLILSHQVMVFAYTTWTFCYTSKVPWKLNKHFVTVIKTYFIKSPKLFGKTRSMTVSQT